VIDDVLDFLVDYGMPGAIVLSLLTVLAAFCGLVAIGLAAEWRAFWWMLGTA
jgi:hypothetical protein